VNRLARRVATIAWPAFLGAGVLEMAVFAFVDPTTLSVPGGEALALSATTVYSLAFFVFWAAAAAACALTLLLAQGAEDLNVQPLTGSG
jgi:hypothetical protein